MFCSLLFVLFLLAIVLFVLQHTVSDYPFGIYKLFLQFYQYYLIPLLVVQPLNNSLHVGVGYDPRGLSYKVFNFPSHPDHKYIWSRGRDLNH